MATLRKHLRALEFGIIMDGIGVAISLRFLILNPSKVGNTLQLRRLRLHVLLQRSMMMTKMTKTTWWARLPLVRDFFCSQSGPAYQIVPFWGCHFFQRDLSYCSCTLFVTLP